MTIFLMGTESKKRYVSLISLKLSNISLHAKPKDIAHPTKRKRKKRKKKRIWGGGHIQFIVVLDK